jgi:site-specific DNA recombinase
MLDSNNSLAIVGYARVSTLEQARHGESLETQKQRIRRFLDRPGVDLVDIIVDDGKSGKNLDREGFQEVLRRLRTGEADGLCVSRLDRMTRRVRHLIILVEDVFLKKGRHLLSVAEQIDTNTPVGRACLAIIAALAQLEREQIAERVHEVLQEKIRRGERAGAVPYGFELDPADPSGKKLLSNPDEQAVIELQKTLRAQGWSYKRIADELSGKGIPTKSGNSKWIHTAVRRILNRPAGYREGDSRTDPRDKWRPRYAAAIQPEDSVTQM